MAAGLFGGLFGEALRNEARNLFAGFWERGISANKALQELRDLGLGYRRQDFLRDFAQGLSSYTQETKVKFIGGDKVPSESILLPKYHGVPDRYSFVFQAKGIDTATGEDTEQYFYYHRDSLDTRSNMEQDAQDWMDEQATSYGIETESVSIKEGYVNPVWEGGV